MSNGVSEIAQTPVNVVPVLQAQPFLLGSRKMDFFMLGGLSILLWIPIYFMQNLLSPVRSLGLALPGIAVLLAYGVNHPHFMAII